MLGREHRLRRYTPHVNRLAVALGAVVAVGCGAAPVRLAGPEGTVSDLALALSAGDTESISRAAARSLPEVSAAVEGSRAELHALGQTLEQTPVERSARVALADGGTIVLVRDGESWRVDRGVLGRPALGRPVDAVLALHDALARSRIQAVLALLARTPRAEIESQLARWLDGTADPDALQIDVRGEQASVRTPTGEQLELVRESGEWHLVDLR